MTYVRNSIIKSFGQVVNTIRFGYWQSLQFLYLKCSQAFASRRACNDRNYLLSPYWTIIHMKGTMDEKLKIPQLVSISVSLL